MQLGGSELLGMHQKRRSRFGNQWTRTKYLGAQEKATKKCGNSLFLKKCQEDLSEEAVEDGHGICKKVGNAGSWHLARRKVEFEAASKKESDSLSLLMEVNKLEIQEYLSTMATLFFCGGRVDGQSTRRRGGNRSLMHSRHVRNLRSWHKLGVVAPFVA